VRKSAVITFPSFQFEAREKLETYRDNKSAVLQSSESISNPAGLNNVPAVTPTTYAYSGWKRSWHLLPR
jgi:hypothetical protein